MKVTALKVNVRNRSRVSVFLDGEFAFSLVKIEAARLRLGQELDAADVARLKQADGVEKAYERALKFLATRPRSEMEVRRRLKKHGEAEANIDAVLERLRRAGLVDDQAFAKFWVENRTTFRPKSRRALRSELKRQGVGEGILQQALRGVDDDELAYRAAARRAVRLSQLDYDEFRRKLGDYLGRQGFYYETIRSVVERVWQEKSAADAE